METAAPQKKKRFERIFAGQKSLMVIQKASVFFTRLPHLPMKIKNFIILILPWLVLLGGIVSSITVVLSFVLTVLSLIALDLLLILTMSGSMLMVLLNALFLVKAFKPLRKKNAVGWIYLFWANILGLFNSLMNIFTGEIYGVWPILATVFFTLLGFYVLFEVGPSYAYDKE